MRKYEDPQELMVEAVRIGKNQAYKSVFDGSEIVFVLESLLLIKLPDMLELKVETQYLICIPKGVCFRCSSVVNSLILIADIGKDMPQCKSYHRSDLDCKQGPTKQVYLFDRQLTSLKMNQMMHAFARELNRALSIKKMNKPYFEIKINACLILLRLCYGIVERTQ